MKTALKLLTPVVVFLAAATTVACSNGTPPTGDGGSTTTGGSSSGSSSSSGTSSSSSSGSTGGSSSGAIVPGGLNSPCTVPTGSATDSCAAQGYSCTPSSPSSTTGTCQLPGANTYCLPAVGCAKGNACLQISTTPVQYACFQNCTATADCTLTSSNCQKEGNQYICNGNTCGPNLPKGSPPASGPAYYAPCNAAGTDDGMCLPYDETGVGTIGLCFAAGPADAGLPSSCTLNREDGGTLCPLGTFCLPDPDTGNSACMPLCGETGPDDAGPACAASSYCLGIPGGPEWGLCLTGCTSSTTCTASENCAQVPGLDAGTVCAP